MQGVWLLGFAIVPAVSIGLSAQQILPCAADVLFLNGRVYTSNPQKLWVEAVAVCGTTIAAVGSTAELKSYAGPRTKVIDLGGHLLLPGLIDSYAHFFWGSDALQGLNLTGASTAAAMEERIARFAAAHRSAKWILGGGWMGGSFPPSGLPSKEFLDRVVPDRPAVMTDLDHHAFWVNSKALEAAGITKDTPDPSGRPGSIVRDPSTREPTGVLEEGAKQLMERVMPPVPHKERLRRLRMALRFANELGITSVINASGDLGELQIFDELRKGGQLTVRMTTAFAEEAGMRHTLSANELARFERARQRYHNDWVKSDVVGFFVDGIRENPINAPGDLHTGRPEERGRIAYAPDELKRLYTEVDRRGFQIMTRAIGEQASRTVLDAYEAVEQRNGTRDRRLRIELLDAPRPQDVPRFIKLHVIPSLQFSAPGDGAAPSAFPEAVRQGATETPSWAEAIMADTRPAFGSNWPSTELNPFVQMQNALRIQALGRPSPENANPEEQVKIEQLVSGYTSGSAYAEFMESKLGSIEPGKLADLVVVSQNVFTIPAAQVSTTRVMLTMVGGSIVWRNGI